MLAGLVLAAILGTLTACGLTGNVLLPGDEFDNLLAKTEQAMHERHWDVARSELDQAVTLKPDSLNIKLQQGLSYQMKGQLALAHNAYQQILDEAAVAGGDARIVRMARANQTGLGFSRLEETPRLVSATKPAALPPEEVIWQAEIPVDVEILIDARMQAWLSAWQEQRLDDYFACYLTDFAGDSDSSQQWRAQRASSISGAGIIIVRVSGLKMEQQSSELVRATFMQSYRSATYSGRGLKTLLFKKVGGNWLIAEERFSEP